MLPLPLVLAFAAQPSIDSNPVAPTAPPAFDAATQTERGTNTANDTAHGGTPSGFNYSYVELDIGRVNLDGVSDDLTAFGINGSYSVAEQVFLFSSYHEGYTNISGVGDVDTGVFLIGVGWHTPLADEADFFAKFALVLAEADLGSSNDDDEGWDLEAGVRYWATDRIELDGSIEYEDVSDSETGVNLAGRYYFTPPVSAGLELSFFEDSNAAFINLRYAF